MAREQLNMIDYLVSCVGAFAERFSITNQYAYTYLNKFQGLDFLFKHYNIEHTQSIEDSVEDITAICLRRGGNLQANLGKMNTEEQHKHDKQFLIECLSQELIAMLMETHHWDISKAMEVLYSSKTYSKLEKDTTGLYFQGAVYIFDILEEELTSLSHSRVPESAIDTKQ